MSEELKANGVTGIFEGDNGTGYVVTAEKTGYGGAVVVTVGFDTEGKILSVKANVSTETQGVGSKVGCVSFLQILAPERRHAQDRRHLHEQRRPRWRAGRLRRRCGDPVREGGENEKKNADPR